MQFDKGRIFDFEIKEKTIELVVDWVNFPPKEEIDYFSTILISGGEIWWENLPETTNLK